MDSIVEENGNSSSNLDDGGHNLSSAHHQQTSNATSTIVGNVSAPPAGVSTTSVLSTVPLNSYHLGAHGIPVQSVIQTANPSSVIQANTQSALGIPKGVVYINKPNNSVIHTTSGASVHIKPEPSAHHLDTSEDSITDEDSPRRKDLTRRPSYHKIFNDISGPDISDNSVVAEDQSRKREIRLQKNREAARECRRKKKEYIKCLENRVAVLENQNKALIEELKSLKELYCQTKND